MALTILETNVVLDLYDHDGTRPQIKSIALDDNTRYVFARLTYKGQTYDIGSDATVKLIIIRPDKVGAQVIGETKAYEDYNEDETVSNVYGAYAELDQPAIAVAGMLLGQFIITSGDQVLRSQIFSDNNGEALDADEWAGQYDGYNLDELVEKVDNAVDKVDGMEADVSELKSGLIELQDGGYVADAQKIQEKIDKYLDEHPEATTTVQDGSITKATLSDDLVEQFISGDYNITRFNNAKDQETFVYWRFIPKDYAPMVAYSDDVDYAVKLANEEGATCAVNASRFRPTTKDFYGYFQVGENVLNTNEFEDSSISTDSRHILCCKNGVLSAQPIRTSTQELIAEGYDWALTGFETIIIDGESTERATPDNILSTDFSPRSFIAQNYDGSYIIGCCDGRSGRSNGFRLSDIYRFLNSTGYNIRFAYSLDGGGSVTLVEKGDRVNSFINNENRQVKSVIYFKKHKAYYNDLLKKSVANIEDSFRSRINSYEYKEGDIFSYSNNDSKNIEFCSLESLHTQAYIRLAKDRVFIGFANDFSDDGTFYNLINIGKTYFEYNNIARYLPRLTNATADYTNEIPNIAQTGINCVSITSATYAESLGLTSEDYGRCLLITFRTNANLEMLLTRANIWYRYDRGTWHNVGITPQKIAITPTTGISGEFYAIKSSKTVSIQADVYVSTTKPANSVIGSGLPASFVSQQNGLMFSASKTCRLKIDNNGDLITYDEMPSGYYRVSMTYITS